MSIKYIKGNLFKLASAPASEPLYLAHACNCLGIWGGGIAAEFKRQFASTFKVYNQHCLEYQAEPENLLGTALVIPVSHHDRGFVPGTGEKLSVVCLFTSIMGQESSEEIAEYTRLALNDLKRQLDESKQKYTLAMPKINAGIFGVPWNLTEQAIKQAGVDCIVYEL